PGMNNLIEALLQLQSMELSTDHRAVDHREIKKLRKIIPAPILKRYGELRLRGKPAAALVRNGVCGQCHMQVAIGLLASLRRRDDIYCCKNCGVYLSVEAETTTEAPVGNAKASVRAGSARPRH